MTRTGKSFAVADRVLHSQYGTGTIAAIESEVTVIDFDKNGRRKFVTSMVQLDPTEIQEPARPAPKSRAKAAKPKK